MSSSTVTTDIPSHTGLSGGEVAKVEATAFESENSNSHYIYCFSFDKNGDKCWYVGETCNLQSRITTHAREKNIIELETIECANDRTEALERERSMSYEMAIEKQTTDIYGGR